MDINKIIKDSVIEESIQETLAELTFKNTELNDAVINKESRQKAALLALKRDPAVMDARVTIKQRVIDSQKVQSPKKSKKNQSHNAKMQQRLDFENKMQMARASLFSLTSNQYNLLLQYVDNLRKQRMSLQKKMECGFCKNNRQPEVWYTAHVLKDNRSRVQCPVLRNFVCPRCGATGDNAHTVKYCTRKN